MKNFRDMVAAVWRIATPYFRSEDKVAGLVLLAVVIGIELSIVAINVLLAEWRNRFFNALQERNWGHFTSELIYFCVLAAIFIVLAVYQTYLQQWLQIRWRNWMTTKYLGRWLSNANHYRMQLQGDAADNPDQRIAEDIRLFIERTLSIVIGLLSAIVTLASFIVMLWGLSKAAPLHLFGRDFDIPGYLVWGALVYAIIGTMLTHWIGRPLVSLNFMQQRYEADFRFNLVRTRENAEQIALLHGENAERATLKTRFGHVVDNWLGIMSRTKKLTALTASYSQATVVFPYILTAPAYFARKFELGGIMQTASAFGSVQDSFSFIVSNYSALAEWRSIVMRLEGFEAAMTRAEAMQGKLEGIQIESAPAETLTIDDLIVNLPSGVPVVTARDIRIEAGESTLLTGPSGSGKSSLFRAVAGVWPFGHGMVTVPKAEKLMVLPQRPYFPIGPLREAIAYPSAPDSFSDTQLAEALRAVGLPQFTADLGEERHWNRTLSLGEQQRLALARVLLQAPRFLLLDEATASLDEPSESALYRMLGEVLPQTTIVSIGHRSSLRAFHRNRIELVRNGKGFELGRKAADAAAQSP